MTRHAAFCQGCDDIGGCYRCGAVPFCRVIDEDAICIRCGADQEWDPSISPEAMVKRDLRAIRGLRAVKDDHDTQP